MVTVLFAAASASGYSGVVRLVQWCVIAFIFLFFLRVVRAVWVEVRPVGPRRGRVAPPPPVADGRAPRTKGRSKGPLLLEVVEPTDRAGHRFDVDDEITLGRSPSCGIAMTYDVYASTVHARIFRDGSRISVEDLGSTNGTFVNSERVSKPTRLGRGDLVQVGGTVFQVTK